MTSPATPGKNREPGHILEVLTAAGLILSIAVFMLTWSSEHMWIGHAVTGVFGFLQLAITAISGAVIKKRLTLFRVDRAFRIHKIASITFVILVGGTFLFGMFSRVIFGEPALTTPHGLLGLVIVVLALVQLIPHHILSGNPYLRAFHRINGYILVPLFVLQMYLGISMSELFEGD